MEQAGAPPNHNRKLLWSDEFDAPAGTPPKRADQLRPGLPQEVALNSDMGGSNAGQRLRLAKAFGRHFGLWEQYSGSVVAWLWRDRHSRKHRRGTRPSVRDCTCSRSFQGRWSKRRCKPQLLAQTFTPSLLIWEPDRLTWQVDGLPYHALTKTALGNKWVFDHPFYLLLNLAVGGWLGGELDPRARPSDFVVDFVRWYDLPRTGILESPP